MNPTRNQYSIVSWPAPEQVFGVCGYCNTPNRARVLVTDHDGSSPRLVCADDVFCAGAQPITLPIGPDGHYVLTEDVRSLGEQPHDATHCIDQGRPHLGACLDPQSAGTAEFVLRAAATYLERYGWIQGAYYDATSQTFTPAACMVGAIGMVCYGGPVDAPAQMFDDPGFLDFEEAVLHLDRFLLVEDGSESYEFNDAKGRQVDDVCRVLRQAADTPAEELIDAIRAIDQKNADIAAIAQQLTPSGIWGDGKEPCPWCGRRAPVIDGRLATHLRHPSTPTDNCVGDPTLRGGDVR
jgi:hypothetical protein